MLFLMSHHRMHLAKTGWSQHYKYLASLSSNLTFAAATSTITDLNTKTEPLMYDSVQARKIINKKYSQLPYISAVAIWLWRRGVLQKQTQPKLTSRVSLSTSVHINHPFTLKAISIFQTEQRSVHIINSDKHLNNHKNKIKSNSRVKTTNKTSIL